MSVESLKLKRRQKNSGHFQCQIQNTDNRMNLSQRIRNIDSLRLVSDALHRMEERQFETVFLGMSNKASQQGPSGLIGMVCLVAIFIGAVVHYLRIQHG